MKRRIVPGGILALSLAVVLLAATSSTASTESTASAETFLVAWYCPLPPTPPTTFGQIPPTCRSAGGGGWGGRPFHFDFGNRQVRTTSRAQRFWLAVLENDSFNPRISVSGDYAQTNNCPPTLSVTAPGQDFQACLITVRFTPRGTGPKRGTLSTGPGGPTARLIGNGVTTPTPSPGLQLWGKKKQNPQADPSMCDRYWCNVVINVSCGVDACTVRATGRLTNVKRRKLRTERPLDIRPGRTIKLGPELTRASQRREVRKALDRGENVKAIVTVRATDAAGNVATAKRTIKLVKNTGASPRPPKAAGAPYDTKLTITQDRGPPHTLIHGKVFSGIRKCEVGRRVAVFKQQPGADRLLGTVRSEPGGSRSYGSWWRYSRQAKAGWHVYARARRAVRRRGVVCRSDRSPIYTVRCGLYRVPCPSFYTTVTITQDRQPPNTVIHGEVRSAYRNCGIGRRVALFEQQPGTDRKLGEVRSRTGTRIAEPGVWGIKVPQAKAGWHVYARVRREVRARPSGFVCRRDRSPIYTVK